jgi:phospholipid transport system substrate-binding protein
MKLTRFSPFIVLLCFAGSWAFAATPTDAQRLHDIINTKSAIIIDVLQDKSIDRFEKNGRIMATVEKLIDFELMAKLSMGNDWWQLTAAQQAEYVALFSERIKYMYLGTIYNFTGQDIQVDPARELEKGCIAVPSHLINGGIKTEMLYKFYRTEQEDWRIYDIKIEGVSMVLAYRADFSSYMGKSCASGLIQQLRENQPD